jgi:hypothetical protein
MRQLRRYEPVQVGDQRVDALGRNVELKAFDGDEAVALRIECTKDRTECSSANLVKNAKGTERVRRRAGRFRVQ